MWAATRITQPPLVNWLVDASFKFLACATNGQRAAVGAFGASVAIAFAPSRSAWRERIGHRGYDLADEHCIIEKAVNEIEALYVSLCASRLFFG